MVLMAVAVAVVLSSRIRDEPLLLLRFWFWTILLIVVVAAAARGGNRVFESASRWCWWCSSWWWSWQWCWWVKEEDMRGIIIIGQYSPLLLSPKAIIFIQEVLLEPPSIISLSHSLALAHYLIPLWSCSLRFGLALAFLYRAITLTI